MVDGSSCIMEFGIYVLFLLYLLIIELDEVYVEC